MNVKLPPALLVLACLLLFGFAELGGAILGGAPEPIKEFAEQQTKLHPDAHGLTGIEDIDRTIVAKVSSTTLARLHTFHLHSHGIGMLAFILFLVIYNVEFSQRQKKILTTLVCLGMFYPFGWLALMFTIPLLGITPATKLVEKIFFMPFGLGMVLAIWLVIFTFCFVKLKSRESNDGKH